MLRNQMHCWIPAHFQKIIFSKKDSPSTTPEKIGVLMEHAFSCIYFIDYKNFVTQSSTEKAAGWAY